MSSPSEEQEVLLVCSQLIEAVQVMTSPTSPQPQRIEAFQKCEQFKQQSPLAVQCGFRLSATDAGAKTPVVRHFGLKILEDIIKLRWNEMSPEQKLFIKENVMQMLAASNPGELSHIKDGMSRLCVEIIKREWPQHWPALLSELDALCAKGETQTEMVMRVMLRLVEDVAVLQTLEQTQRRKEIYQALTANMQQIFSFLLQLLEKHYQAYLALKPTQPDNRHCQVCQAILDTFSAFVEWVAIAHITANDKYLIRCLCHLLSDDRLQMHAADCLLGIVSWRAGKPCDRMQLLCLFSTDMMAPLFQAAEQAIPRALEEEHYNFLKKMVQILAELGGQLCVLWVQDAPYWKANNGGKRPDNFDVYLNALLSFTRHPSQTVNLTVNEVWVKFLRHSDISRDPVFQSFVPKWVESVLKKFIKVGFPSRSDHPACNYSQLDFDTDEEFLLFFGKYRTIIVEGIRLVSAESPANNFQYAEAWLKQVLSTPVNIAPEGIDGKCSQNSHTYVELDGLAVVLDAILSKQTPAQLQVILAPAVNLTQLLFDYRTDDPILRSALLSCVSSCFPIVVATANNMLMPALSYVFSCITFAAVGKQPNDPHTAEVHMLRRHACALMVKLATRHPKTLLPLFDHLRDSIVQMKTGGQIGHMEFATLVEALTLISNELSNYQLQATFLKVISDPVCAQLHKLEAAIASPQAFLDFIGLSKPAESSALFQANRAEIKFCLNFLLAVCRRADHPSDIEACRSGGFVLQQTQGDQCVALRNPAWDVAASVLRHVLLLAKTMNSLWSPANIALLHPDYAKALGMLDSERNSVCGVGNSKEKGLEEKTKTPITRMRTFLFEVYENNYHFLSQMCVSHGYEFYQQPQLADGLVVSLLENLDPIPDYRLRALVRMFLKPLINKCPKVCYSSVLAPVLQSFCPYILARLTERWKYLVTLRESPTFDEDNTDSQEVLDDVVCRQLGREYLDVIKAILTSGNGSDIPVASLSTAGSNTNGSTSGSNGHEGGADNAAPADKSGAHKLALSELGQLVLQHDSLGKCVILTLLRALVWPDSPCSIRSCSLLELILPTLVQNQQLSDADASQIMVSILSAIHELGQHEINYINLVQLAVQAYEWLRPRHAAIVEVLAQVPGCSQEDLKRFDDRVVAIIQGKENKGGDRIKKDMFKKLISQFIGKDVAKMFKHDVVIKNLPTLQLLKAPKQKTPSLDETEKSDIGICSLFAQNGAALNGATNQKT